MDNESVAGRYDAPHEAELAATYLRAHGIAARVENDVVASMNPLWAGALGFIRVQVPTDRLDEATTLLAALRRPKGEEAPDADDREARRALISSTVGLFVLPVVAQLYSLWLIARLPSDSLSDAGRRHKNLALAVDLGVLVAAAYMVMRL